MTRNPTVTGSDQIRIRQYLDPQYDYTVVSNPMYNLIMYNI